VDGRDGVIDLLKGTRAGLEGRRVEMTAAARWLGSRVGA